MLLPPHILSMIQKAEVAMGNAYVPICDFPVGSCLMTPTEQFFAGCNFEIASTPLSACAETSAISAMVSSGCREIQEIVVVAQKIKSCLPCGACRQRIAEFSTPNTLIHLCSHNELHETFTIEQLLPHTFKML